MIDVPYGIKLMVDVTLRTRTKAEEPTAISTGYRPLCRFGSPNREAVTVGMCQFIVEGDRSIHPGESGVGMLVFAQEVSDLVRTLATVGEEIGLAEGATIIGSARVRAIE